MDYFILLFIVCSKCEIQYDIAMDLRIAIALYRYILTYWYWHDVCLVCFEIQKYLKLLQYGIVHPFWYSYLWSNLFKQETDIDDTLSLC